MSKELDDLRAECDHAKQQAEIWRSREERAKQRIKYQRSAKDRKRTHHLIQYGAAFECHHKELSVLSDEEVFQLVESVLEIPDVCRRIQQSVEEHNREGRE
ncbi:MAG: DUF3847 domain-containing protein [Lachnospiraceae bacterium]|nr:DUF3847 domain-containing protein [Lachnospiraceae bacterium]